MPVQDFKTSKDEREITLGIELADTTEGNVELFTEEVVNSVFKAQAIVKAQAYVRSLISAKNEDGSFVNSDEDVAEKFSAWKLSGGNRVTKSASDKALDLMAGMSPEALQALLTKHAENQAAAVDATEEVEYDSTDVDEG